MASRLMMCLALLACLVIAPQVLRADEVAQSGRAIAAKWKDALVTIKVAAKITVAYQGEEHTDDDKEEITGVVIDPSGLIAVSLSSVDPVEAFSSMGGDEDGTKATATITSLRILFSDGTEVDGNIELRDKDLDLAFIRPKAKLAKPVTAVDLTKSAQPELLDQVVLLYRLGAIANRALNVTVDRVEAIIEKPRKQYVLGMSGSSAENGSPVFSLDGNVVGVLLRKAQFGPAADMQNDLYIVLPAADVIEASQQATEDAAKN